MPDRILRWPEVRTATGLSRTTVWRLERAGEFPSPVKITQHAIGWRATDVHAWLASRCSVRAGVEQCGRPE